MQSIGALTGKFDAVKSEITGIAGKIDNHTSQLAALTRETTEDRANVVDLARVMDERTDELSQTMAENRRAMPDIIKKVLDERLDELGVTGSGGANNIPQISSCQSLSESKEERYLLARRSLLVWPLENASPESLSNFAKKYLQMTAADMANLNLDVISIRNCRKSPHMKIQQEYSVEFASAADRDTFRSYAPRLHEFRRTAGMRLALPDFLVSPFKTLEHEAFLIAQRVPGTKRNIKLDDAARSVVLDIKLPGASWVRITPLDVLQASGARRKERVPEVSEILAIGGRPLPLSVEKRRQGRQDHHDHQDQRQGQSQSQERRGDEEEEECRFDSDADMTGDEIAGENA